MSLTRIDFTGQSKSSTVIMDENQNNRIQRQNTQVLQNPASRRHGFALPNVLDGNLTVVGHQNYHHQSKYQGKVFRSSDQSKLPPSANMMTTADSILGDPQRKVRGDRTADMGLSLQSGTPQTSAAPSVESLFASPNFPFFGKLSQCDLEKPLRTCFHLEKIPGHRNDFQPCQEHFVTPSASSELPQLQQPQPVDLSQSTLNQANTPADDHAVPDIRPAKQCLESTTGKSNCHESNQISMLPLPGAAAAAELINQQERFSQESLIKFDSICNQLGKTVQEREQEETVRVPSVAQNNTPQSQNPSEGVKVPELVHQGRDSLNNWIGEPFMQQHAYYQASFVKDSETTDTESESYYATPMGESQDEHEPGSNERSILAAIQELKQFIDGKRTVEIAQNLGTLAMFPILVPTVAARNTNFENGTTSSSLEEPPVETRMRLLSSEFTEISYSSPENSATPDYSQIETEISDGVRTDSYEDGDGGADSLREGSTNSMKTIKSSSSCTKSSTPDRSHPRNRNHQSFFKHRTGSDADDESCDSQSTDIPLRLSSTRLKSKTTLTKRHQRLKRRSSSTKRNGSFPKIKSPSKESSNRKNSNQTRADARSDTENTIPELKSDDDTMSPLHRSESDLIRLRNFQLNESAEDENEYENSLPDTLFGTESPEETVQCGTSEYNRASKGSQAEGSLITPLPSLESKLDNRIDSSPEGSNQTVIMRGNKTPEIIYNMKSSSSQPSVERIFFKAADVEPLVRRRPARTRPKTTGCVEDSVAMWEGIQINHSDQILIGDEEEITFQNIPRPPTRRRSCTRDSERRRLRMNSTSTKSKADKKQTIKTINAKIQNLISNVNRVGELHREKLQTEGKKLKEIKLNQRPQTSPPMNPIPKLPTWIEKTSRNRPSTSVPSSPAESTSQKSNGLSSKTKNPRSKRSLSQSATPRADPTSWNVTSRPVTATAVRFSTRSKPNSMTVRTTFVDNNNPTKPSEIHGKSKQEGKVPKKLPSHKSADEEPLELLFSFKTNKSPPKRTLSPVGLAPQQNQMDQASLYKHIEIHRRQALCEAQKVLAKKRSLLRKIEKDLTDTSTSALSSPLSSPKRVASANNFHRPYNNTNNKPQQTKQLLKELSNQVHLEKSFEMTRKLAKMKDKVKSKSANTSNNPAEKCFVPLPMSKRVHFSSPIQTKLPRVKLSVNTSKQQKAKSQSQQTSAPRSRSQTPTLDNNYTISFNTPTYPPGKVKVSVRKVPKQVTRKAQDINEGEDEDSDRDGNDGDTATNASSHWSLSETNIDQSENDDDTNDNILERLEGLRDKIRGKEFERRKRGKGDQDPNKKGPVYSSLSLYLPKRKKSEKMIDMKIIVRRKTKDGKFPSLDDAVGHLSSKCTYLIVDEEPLTKSGPNPYLEAQMKQAKPKGTAVPTLKITTSEASTIESLPSEEALTRFLTCYVCGQTLNIRDYFSHERKCVHNIHKNNQYLADEDKRILPQKPQGTITIKHWNTFAHESIKNKLIRCPYCEMEFFPDHPEDANFHKETCTNRPLPSVAPPRGLNLTDHYTVLMAEEAQGWVVPTTKELHRNNWTPGYSRVEQYTRPAENRVRKYKKPKLVVQESSTQIGKKKKKIAP